MVKRFAELPRNRYCAPARNCRLRLSERVISLAHSVISLAQYVLTDRNHRPAGWNAGDDDRHPEAGARHARPSEFEFDQRLARTLFYPE